MRNFLKIFHSVLYKIEQFQTQRKVNRLISQVRKEVTPMHKGSAEGGANPVLLCLVYNGTYFIESFMDHYLRLGFKEFVFIDNNSTDDTVNKLKEHNVTILQSTLPYRIYKWAFKQFLVHEYGENRWSLYVDIDELWEYPSQDQLSLDKYFQYLDQHSYNAVMSIMLDLFADIPLKDLHSLKNRALKDTYTFYDNSALNISPYRKAYNITNHPETAHFRGGIHDLIFGIDVIYLSKIPLIKWNKTISVHETSHTSTNVNIADVSTVLLHYKFVYGFYEKIQLAIEENSYWNANKIYRQYLNVIKENININLRSNSSKLYNNPNQLEDEKAVWISNQYKKWVTQNN